MIVDRRQFHGLSYTKSLEHKTQLNMLWIKSLAVHSLHKMLRLVLSEIILKVPTRNVFRS